MRINAAVSNGNLKPSRFLLNLFTFCSIAHYPNGSLSFVLIVDEETNGSCPFANGLNGLAHLWL
jgi:hypothetical protein